MFLTRYKPGTNLQSIFDTLDSDFFPALRPWFDGDPDSFRLPMTNINETEKEYVLTMEMPGVDKKNVNVAVEKDTLVITGERTEKIEAKGLLRSEIRSERFRRSFTIDSGVDAKNIKARLENGLLKLTLPKLGESVGRKIDIE
jgi:HSP20 family protein